MAASELAEFRTIVQNSTDGIMILDALQVVRYANPATELLYGRHALDLIGETFTLPIGAPGASEIAVVRADGSRALAELRAVEMLWEGQPATLIFLRDITKRRLMEDRERTLIREQAARAEAEASERRARFLSEAAASVADSLDQVTTLRTLARQAVPFLADWCVVDFIDGTGAPQRIAVTYADPRLAETARIIESCPPNPDAAAPGEQGKELDHSFIEHCATETERAAWRSLNPARALILPLLARGHRLGSITLVTAASGRRFNQPDVDTALELARRAAIALDNAQLYQRAQQSAQTKQDFLAVMSHELRTPLNAIIGYSDLLLMGVPVEMPAAARGHVDRIRKGAHHLLQLIEEILTFARIEAGRENLRLSDFDARAVIQDGASIVRPLIDDKHLVLRVSAPDLPCSWHSDHAKVRQILVNLLTNAIKFTDDGEVGIDLRSDGEHTEFTVWDTGIGIDRETLPRIFEPFWQAEQPRTRRVEGTGLGLTVARRLARLLGGDLLVDSQPAVGSRFTLRIPTRYHQLSV